MPKATWRGVVIAESDDTVVVEGNHYFPRASLDASVVEPSSHTSYCPWKGTAHYLSIQIGEERNEDAIWFYPEPSEAAAQIRDRVAFWRGVEVS